MGNRLSIISTRTGDDGTTGLGDGSRISKSSLRIQAIGDIDELNSYIGLIYSYITHDYLKLDNNFFFKECHNKLISIQHDLFNLGGELSIPMGYKLLEEKSLIDLDEWIKNDNANLKRLQEFILPSGSILASYTHIARSVCRRGERSIIALTQEQNNCLRPIIIQYVNRLSDWLFIISRCINKNLGVAETLWQR